MATRQASPAEVLRRDEEAANKFAIAAGKERARKVLETAQRSLNRRLVEAQGLRGPGKDSFTAAQLRATLAQVRAVLRPLQVGIGKAVIESGDKAAERSAAATIRYLNTAEAHFKGAGTKPLALDEASILDQATSGAHASILRRIATDPDHPSRKGVLERYGHAVIERFEGELQQRFLARTPWDKVRDNLIEQSPFLQKAPAYWAERIVRTETMGASNRAAWESIRTADKSFGDMCKIIACIFDDRTGADSVAIHGQIRRPEEAFESWYGAFQHPPDRPNDRAAVVPHRIAWPIPDYLAQRDEAEILSTWTREGRKGSPPDRPLMTTIDLSLFGAKAQEPDTEESTPTAEVIPAEVIPSMETDAQEPLNTAEITSRTLPRFRNEEARAKYAEDELNALPRVEGIDDDVVIHRLPVGRPFPEHVQDRIAGLVELLEKHESNDEAPAIRRVRIDRLVAREPDVRAAHVLEDIHEAQQPPIVVRVNGELHIQRGLETVIARDLGGLKTIDAHVIDLDAKVPFKPRIKPLPEPTKLGDIPLDKIGSANLVEEFTKEKKAKGQAFTIRGPVQFAQEIFGSEMPTLSSFEKIWGGDNHKIEISSIGFSSSGGEKSMSFDGQIMSTNGEKIGRITRTFIRHEDGTIEVHHDYFRIDDVKKSGGGGGEAMLRQSILAYEKLGVNKITVDSAWVGKYTWASFGYNWDAESAELRARELAYYLRKRGGIEASRAEKIANQVAPRAWDVAALDVDGKMILAKAEMAGAVAEPMRLGKAFLLESSGWSGTLKLDPKDETYKRAKVRLKF